MKIHTVTGSLHSIDSYLLSNTPEKASEYLSYYGEYIRKIIETSAKPEYSLAEELDYCREFLELESYRVSGAFEYEIQISEQVNAEEINFPSLMLLPVVENAVKHGIESLIQSGAERKGKIKIEVIKKDNFIVCKVKDNGMGLNYNPVKRDGHQSYSKKGMEERIAIYNQIKLNKISYTIQDEAEGVLAELKMIII